MRKNSAVAAVVLGLAAFPALAGPEIKSVTCTSSAQQADGSISCGGGASYKVTVKKGTSRDFAVSLRAPAAHCSQVRYIVANRNTSQQIGMTGWLSTGQAGVVQANDLPEGFFTFAIFAEGRIGGCNQGQLASWGVTVDARLIQ